MQAHAVTVVQRECAHLAFQDGRGANEMRKEAAGASAKTLAMKTLLLCEVRPENRLKLLSSFVWSLLIYYIGVGSLPCQKTPSSRQPDFQALHSHSHHPMLRRLARSGLQALKSTPRRGGGAAEWPGGSFWSQGTQTGHNGFLFGEIPPAPGQKRARQWWETIW